MINYNFCMVAILQVVSTDIQNGILRGEKWVTPVATIKFVNQKRGYTWGKISNRSSPSSSDASDES